MPQKADHTWNVTLHYHRCPKCGYILESREDYQYKIGGLYQKDLECNKCKYRFTENKERKLAFGPLIGEPEPAEIDWKE